MEQQKILLPNTEFKPNFITQAQLKIDRADNLPFLASELKRQRVTKKDYIAPAGKLKIIPRPTDIILNMENTGEFELTANFHNQIASKLEIPQGYYERLKASSPDLLSKNINHWMADPDEKPKLIRTLDGKARAFLSDKYKIIDNDDVFFMSVDEMGKSNMQFFRADLTENYLFLKAISTSTQAEIRKGDIVQAGLMIKNSEIGVSRFQVEPFVLRLFCLNGMVTPDNGMQKTHIGRKMVEGIYSRDTQELNALASLSEMRDIIKATLNGQTFDNTVKALIAASETTIEKPTQAINNICLYSGYNDTEQENIMFNFMRQNDPTKYGLLNAITSTAKNAATAERMVSLETTASEIITLPDETFDEIINRKLRVKRAIAA